MWLVWSVKCGTLWWLGGAAKRRSERRGPQAARGSIVNVSSIHANLTKPGFVAYATSKGALCGAPFPAAPISSRAHQAYRTPVRW